MASCFWLSKAAPETKNPFKLLKTKHLPKHLPCIPTSGTHLAILSGVTRQKVR